MPDAVSIRSSLPRLERVAPDGAQIRQQLRWHGTPIEFSQSEQRRNVVCLSPFEQVSGSQFAAEALLPTWFVPVVPFDEISAINPCGMDGFVWHDYDQGIGNTLCLGEALPLKWPQMVEDAERDSQLVRPVFDWPG